MSRPKSKAPKHLNTPTRRWYDVVITEFELEPHHERLLVLAAEAWGRGVQARETLKTKGPYYVNHHGEPKSHPALAVERDSRIAFARLLRELGLDGGPADLDTRPPRVESRHG